MNALLDLLAVAFVIAATALIGIYGLRVSRTTSDFFVASRTVRPVWNASAISGEYLSAGTFLGLSGLVLLSGSEGFWFPIGYAAGYLLVLLFIAALAVVRFLLDFVSKRGFAPFAWWRIVVGVVGLALLQAGF